MPWLECLAGDGNPRPATRMHSLHWPYFAQRMNTMREKEEENAMLSAQDGKGEKREGEREGKRGKKERRKEYRRPARGKTAAGFLIRLFHCCMQQ